MKYISVSRFLLLKVFLNYYLYISLKLQISETTTTAITHSTSRHSNISSEAGATESWEFRSALEAPIAKLESLDEIDRQV